MSPLETASLAIGGVPVEVLDLPAAAAGEQGAEAGAGAGAAPIVLLHEGLGSVRLWRDFPALLHERTGRRVIAFSRYGHGSSGPPPLPRTPAFFHSEALEVLPELLTALGVSEPVLIGHSDGGSIALIHAAHQRVSGAVLIAPHVFVEELTVEAIRGTREAFLDGGLRARMARHHTDPDAAFWGWCDVWLDPDFARWELSEEIARLSAPLLLIQGADDPYGTLEQIDRIATGARGPVQRLVLAGGHSPHLEHTEAVAEAIASFLERLSHDGGP